MKSRMHVSSPEPLWSKLLSKHPFFTLIRLTRASDKANEHLLNDSCVPETLYVIQSKKPSDIGIIILILQLREPNSERGVARDDRSEGWVLKWHICVIFILHTELCFVLFAITRHIILGGKGVSRGGMREWKVIFLSVIYLGCANLINIHQLSISHLPWIFLKYSLSVHISHFMLNRDYGSVLQFLLFLLLRHPGLYFNP